MKLYLIAAVAISVSCVNLGILSLNGNISKKSRVLFLLMSLSMAWFLFSAGESIAAQEKETVVFWYRLSSIGFAPFYALNLHFYISLLRKQRVKAVVLLLYIPVPILVAATFISQSLFSEFILLGRHWRFYPAYHSPWFWIYLLYYVPYTASTIVLINLRAARSGLRRDRQQALNISIVTGITLIAGSATDFLFPAFEIYTLPPVGPLILGVYIFGLWLVVVRFGFMEPSHAFVATEIIDNIEEMVFLLDAELRIVSMNRWSRKILQLPSAEYPPFPELTQEPRETAREIEELATSKSGLFYSHVEYCIGDRRVITDTYISRIIDSFQDLVGFIVISRQNRDLEEFIRDFGISKREMQVLTCSMAGKSNSETAKKLGIAERTVETHLFHLYTKTGTNNRIELFRLAGKYRLLTETETIN